MRTGVAAGLLDPSDDLNVLLAAGAQFAVNPLRAMHAQKTHDRT
jgi:hypothetical protein